MEGDLNMNNWSLSGVAAPVDDQDAISKIYLNNRLDKNFISERALRKVMHFDVKDMVNYETHTNGHLRYYKSDENIEFFSHDYRRSLKVDVQNRFVHSTSGKIKCQLTRV